MAEVVLLPTISTTSPADMPSFCIALWSMRAIPLPTSLCLASPTRNCTSLNQNPSRYYSITRFETRVHSYINPFISQYHCCLLTCCVSFTCENHSKQSFILISFIHFYPHSSHAFKFKADFFCNSYHGFVLGKGICFKP